MRSVYGATCRYCRCAFEQVPLVNEPWIFTEFKIPGLLDSDGLPVYCHPHWRRAGTGDNVFEYTMRARGELTEMSRFAPALTAYHPPDTFVP